MRIYNNPSAFNTWRQLQVTDSALTKDLEKLSSGMRINRAADDASGLATSEKMRNQLGGLKQAATNAMDGISLIQSADGALEVVAEMFRRVRNLAVKANNDSNTGEERFYIALEIDQLFQEYQAIVGTPYDEDGYVRGRAEFNTRNLFAEGGGFDPDEDNAGFEFLRFQIGANVGQTVQLSRTDLTDEAVDAAGGSDEASEYLQFLTALRALANTEESEFIFNGQLATDVDEYPIAWGYEGIAEGTDDIIEGEFANGRVMSFNEDGNVFENLIQEMDAFVGIVNSLRSTLGAYQNRLEYTVRNLNSVTENTMIAESRIRDTDMVEQMANFTRNNILLQSGTAMMAQANAKPQTVLRLLG